MKACAAQKIEYQGLGIVVGIMRGHHAAESARTAQFRKPSVTKITGRHLYAHTLSDGIFFSIKINMMEAHPVGRSPTGDQFLIPVAFAASEMEITMRHLESLYSQCPEAKVRQTHRVRSPAHGNKIPEGRKRRRGGPFDDLPLNSINRMRETRKHYFLLAMVHVNPNARDSLNCTRALPSGNASRSLSFRIMMVSS